MNNMRILVLLSMLFSIRGFAVVPLRASPALDRYSQLRAVDFEGLMEMGCRHLLREGCR